MKTLFTNGSKRRTLILSTLLGALGLAVALIAQAAQPGPDTYVNIVPLSGSRKHSKVSVGPWTGAAVTIGNAGQNPPPQSVANSVLTLVRVSTSQGQVCEAVISNIGLDPGDSVKAFRLEMRYPKILSPGSPQTVNYTIDAEIMYFNHATSEVETNAANNRKVVTLPMQGGGTPKCVKIPVSFRDDLYPVFSHARCVNCHGRVDPRVPRNHDLVYTSDAEYESKCQECHDVREWTNINAPAFWYPSSGTRPALGICNTVKRSLVAQSRASLEDHLTKDKRIQWSFNPGDHVLQPAPGGYPAWQSKMRAWFDWGKPCPPPPADGPAVAAAPPAIGSSASEARKPKDPPPKTRGSEIKASEGGQSVNSLRSIGNRVKGMGSQVSSLQARLNQAGWNSALQSQLNSLRDGYAALRQEVGNFQANNRSSNLQTGIQFSNDLRLRLNEINLAINSLGPARDASSAGRALSQMSVSLNSILKTMETLPPCCTEGICCHVGFK